MDTNEHISLFDLQIDHESSAYLRETAKWAKFLAILGFVWSGLFLLVGISIMSTRLTYSSSYTSYNVGVSIFYMVAGLIYFFPCLYGLNFARKMRTALDHNDQAQLNTSLRNLKSTVRYLGITAIVGLVLIVAAVILGVFSDLSRI